MRAINVEVSEVLIKLDFSAQINFLQLFGVFMYLLQNVIWLNTRTGLRYKRHILHAPKYDE